MGGPGVSTQPSTGAGRVYRTQAGGFSTVSAVGIGVARLDPDETTQTIEERPLDGRLLFLECLLDPAILEKLTPRGQKVVREQQNRLGSSTDFWTLVVGKALRPLAKLPDLLVVNHEELSFLPETDHVRTRKRIDSTARNRSDKRSAGPRNHQRPALLNGERVTG